jgi:hypothetical protein
LRGRVAIARRSRCCSPTSSAFCGSAACACEAQAAPSSSSRWQPSLRKARQACGSPAARCVRRVLCMSVEFAWSLQHCGPSTLPDRRRRRAAGYPKPAEMGRHTKSDFCNKIGPSLPSSPLRRHGRYWGRSGPSLATWCLQTRTRVHRPQAPRPGRPIPIRPLRGLQEPGSADNSAACRKSLMAPQGFR